MKIYSISSSKLLHTFGHSSSLNDTSPEVIFDTPTIREALKEDDEQSSAEIAGFAVECVGFSSEEFKWVASGGMDSTAKVWDISSGLLRSVCAHTGSVVALKWHLELPTFTTACLDRLVRIWDARNGTLLMRLSGHNDLVTNIATSQIRNNDGEVLDLIITASDDYASKVFAVNIAAALQ